jgi:ABC-type lipoprotein release transport system permease subunit
MAVIVLHGIRDTWQHKRLALALALLVALSTTGYLTLGAYRRGLEADYSDADPGALMVYESNVASGGSLGSRITPEVGALLEEMGISQAIPEIQVVVGTSFRDAKMLRGVDPERYTQVNDFEVIAGVALQPGDPPRSAMLGKRLADKLGVGPGDTVSLRGRDFTVTGVFWTGTYADNEAWVSLGDAQKLVGWGEDVSIYIVPDDGILQEGQTLPGGAAVMRRGEGGRAVVSQVGPLVDLFGVVVQVMGFATLLAMVQVLLRLAWIRRRELAILRVVGYTRRALAVYLMAQASVIVLVGVFIGWGTSLGLGAVFHLEAGGYTLLPVFDLDVTLVALGWAAALTLLGTALPAAWVARLELARLLHTQ